MALHINLYHESLKQQMQRKRDPLKLSSYALALVALILVAYYMMRVSEVHRARVRYIAAKNEWTKLDAESTAAKKEAAEVDALLKASNALTDRIESRFFWAPINEEIARVTTREIQITSLGGEVLRDKQGGVNLAITGVASGDEPRTVADNYRVAILNALSAKYKQVTAVFRSLDDSNDQVILAGQQKATVNFTINIHMGDSASQPAATAGKPKP
jgi:hypothetical protein